MKKYFVTSDTHSFFSIFYEELLKQGFNQTNPDHILIICGDLFDRGQEAVQMYKFVRSLGDRFIYIRGNHEDLLFDCVNELRDNDGWCSSHHYSNGTVNTVIQFKTDNILEEVLDFIKQKSVNYYELNNYIFTHGWVPYYLQDGHDPNQKEGEFSCVMYPVINLNANEEMWKHARWTNGMAAWKSGVAIPGKTIVCGHWHVSYAWYNYKNIGTGEFNDTSCFDPFIEEGIIALDACTAFSKKCNILVLEGEENGSN